MNPISLIGTTLLAVSNLYAATHYVSLESTNPTPPYTNWAMAATNIQDAVNVAVTNDVVLVTNGVYPGGVTVTNPLTLLSANGPQVTAVDGGGTNQCISLTNGASLTGFTVTNGYVYGNGGGVSCASTNAFLTNCTLSQNWANWQGGGVYGGTLYSCTLTLNGTSNTGGGAFGSILYNCTLNGNQAYAGGAVYQGTLYGCSLWRNLANTAGGVYYGTLYNCILVGNSAQRADGGGAYVSTLSNCTLAGNSATSGGGASQSTLFNCRIVANGATTWVASGYPFVGAGGGVFGSTLYNCVLTENSAFGCSGGGAYNCTLYNCTVTSNSVVGRYYWLQPGTNVYLGGFGGGTCASRLYNSIVFFNATSDWGSNYDSSSTLSYCSATPLWTNGVGNITNAPLFVDYAHGDLRLQSNSPCINAGNNAYVTTATDLDGRPRVVGGTVDIGAYEFQPGASGAFIAWLQQYGLPTDGSADLTDPDHDGMNNWQEWICGTCPTNAQSALRLVSANSSGTNVTVTWQSVAGINYFLERSANLAAPFTVVDTNIVGQAGTTSYTDTNVVGPGPFFYRVGVPCQ